MTGRIQNLKKKVKQLDYDAYLVADETNVGYLTNIPVPQHPFLFVKPDGNDRLYVLSDGLRIAEASVGGECEIKAADFGRSSLEALLEDLSNDDVRRIGFDTLSAQVYLRLTKKLRGTMFVPDPGMMWQLRMIKSPDEIESICKAARIADEGQRTAREVLRPGMREYEVAAEVEYAMRVLGSEDEGHRTVVTSGSRTVLGVGSGFTTDRRIHEGELVIVDTGATVNRYRTDLGRPYVLGKPTDKQKEIYRLVRDAWNAAFACVRPGAVAGDVDAAARKAFGEYEKYFDHEVGHGMGLTFEPPALGKNSKDLLAENMVVTVEPGLYIEGFGGILVEDTTLVVKDGAQRLTSPPLEWD